MKLFVRKLTFMTFPLRPWLNPSGETCAFEIDNVKADIAQTSSMMVDHAYSKMITANYCVNSVGRFNLRRASRLMKPFACCGYLIETTIPEFSGKGRPYADDSDIKGW